MPPPTTATSNSCSDSAARAWLRAITRAVSQSARPRPPHASRTSAGGTQRLYLRELCADLADCALGVAEQHRGLGVVVELVFDARETGVHRALDHDHRAAVCDFE